MMPITQGFRHSVNKHNTSTIVLADWIEASALFGDDQKLPTPELVDLLLREEIYKDQDFCWEAIDASLREIRRRSKLSVPFPLSISGRHIDRIISSWRDIPVHSFLLLLTLAQRYDNWTEVMPIDYNLQGELFEEVTRESLTSQLPDWVVHPTGWSRAHPTKLPELVSDIAGRLGEIEGEVKAWTDPEAKEAGLDLLCYRPFPDGNVGIPLLMLQCASGHWNEPGKVKTPDIDIWTKIVIFASRPKRAFATHFSFLKNEFKKVSARVDGVLFDRYRLLSPKAEKEWVSQLLKKRLLEWLEPRMNKFSELAK
jgi:hypothetical protein